MPAEPTNDDFDLLLTGDDVTSFPYPISTSASPVRRDPNPQFSKLNDSNDIRVCSEPRIRLPFGKALFSSYNRRAKGVLSMLSEERFDQLLEYEYQLDLGELRKKLNLRFVATRQWYIERAMKPEMDHVDRDFE